MTFRAAEPESDGGGSHTLIGRSQISAACAFLRHRKRMPIILLAAAELKGELEAVARKAGVKKWVMKTTDMAELCEVIRDQVEA